MRGAALVLCVMVAAAGCARSHREASADATAALLLRCKVAELDEQVMREGLPAPGSRGEDACCAGAELEGHACDWEVQRVEVDRQGLTLATPVPNAEAGDVLDAAFELQARVVHVRVRWAGDGAPGGDARATDSMQVTHLLVDDRVRPADPTTGLLP